jgi:hypothetical protein
MRGLKSTLALLVLLIGLGAYIFFVEQPADTGETKEKAFTGVTAEDIEEVQITLAGGESSRLQKTDGTWQIVDPVKAEADPNEISSITSSLASLDIQRVVDENVTNLQQYGLEPARIDVEFRTKGQKEPQRILLGEKTPTGSDLYAARAGQKQVFVVSSFLDSTFNKNTFALREKKILKFERDKANAIELESAPAAGSASPAGTTRFRFERQGTDWVVTAPIAARGDYGAIEGVVERLSSAQMQGIVEPEAGDLAKYGLDKPTATMTVVMGSSRATLTLGKTDNALVFAKDASRPMVFTVAPTIQTDVFKELSDFRRKDLFDARSFTANRIEFRRGAETMAFEKTKSGDKDVWKKDGKDVDSPKMEELLSKITGLRAQSFESTSHPSLKSPVLAISATFDDKKMETVTFGRAGADVFGARADEAGTARLDAMAFDEAVKSLDALK